MVGPWPHRAFTFRALSKTYGQMWLRCDVCRRYLLDTFLAETKEVGLLRRRLHFRSSAYRRAFYPGFEKPITLGRTLRAGRLRVGRAVGKRAVRTARTIPSA